MSATPLTVKKGVLVLGLALAVSTVYLWLNPKIWEAGTEMPTWMWTLLAIVNVLYALFLVLVWRGRNWARWVVLAWCTIGWIATLSTTTLVDVTTADRMIQFAAIAAEIWAFAQIFSKASSSWFRAPVTS